MDAAAQNVEGLSSDGQLCRLRAPLKVYFQRRLEFVRQGDAKETQSTFLKVDTRYFAVLCNVVK